MTTLASLNATLQSRFKDIECITSTYASIDLTNVKPECKWKNPNPSGLLTLCIHPSKRRYFIAMFDPNYKVLFDYKIHSTFQYEVFNNVIMFNSKDATVSLKFNSIEDAMSFKNSFPHYTTSVQRMNPQPPKPVAAPPRPTPMSGANEPTQLSPIPTIPLSPITGTPTAAYYTSLSPGAVPKNNLASLHNSRSSTHDEAPLVSPLRPSEGSMSIVERHHSTSSLGSVDLSAGSAYKADFVLRNSASPLPGYSAYNKLSPSSMEVPPERRPKSLSFDKIDPYIRTSSTPRSTRRNDVQTLSQIKEIMNKFQNTRLETFPDPPALSLETIPQPHQPNSLFTSSSLPDFYTPFESISATFLDFKEVAPSANQPSSPSSCSGSIDFNSADLLKNPIRSPSHAKGMVEHLSPTRDGTGSHAKHVIFIRAANSVEPKLNNESTPQSSSDATSPPKYVKRSSFSNQSSQKQSLLRDSLNSDPADLANQSSRRIDSILSSDFEDDSKRNTHTITLLANEIMESINKEIEQMSINGTTTLAESEPLEKQEKQPSSSLSPVHFRKNTHVPSSAAPSEPIEPTAVYIKTSLNESSLSSTDQSKVNTTHQQVSRSLPLTKSNEKPDQSTRVHLSKSYETQSCSSASPSPFIILSEEPQEKSTQKNPTGSHLRHSRSGSTKIMMVPKSVDHAPYSSSPSVPQASSSTNQMSEEKVSLHKSGSSAPEAHPKLASPSTVPVSSLLSKNRFIQQDKSFMKSMQQSTVNKMSEVKGTMCEACSKKIARIRVLPCHHIICQNCYAHRMNNVCPSCSCYIVSNEHI